MLTTVSTAISHEMQQLSGWFRRTADGKIIQKFISSGWDDFKSTKMAHRDAFFWQQAVQAARFNTDTVQEEPLSQLSTPV